MEELEKEKEKERQISRDKRREAVDRLLTSMHLLTCSNGLRYFNIKLTVGGQVSRIPVLLQRIVKFSRDTHLIASFLKDP